MSMKVVLYLFIFVILTNFVFGATIHGSIYDLSLTKANNVVVTINTQPRQKYIAKNGTYSFTVPIGDYKIEAKKILQGTTLAATENISVEQDGDFVLDLVLFPSIESDIIEEAKFEIDEDYFKEESNFGLILNIIITFITFLVILIIVGYFFIKRKTKKIEQSDEYLRTVLKIIKDNKRITQKEIRKQLPLSEAKVSLIISELETKGLVKKIKKGRGNIIIYKKNHP